MNALFTLGDLVTIGLVAIVAVLIVVSYFGTLLVTALKVIKDSFKGGK